MSRRSLPNGSGATSGAKEGRRRFLGRLSARAGIFLGALLITIVVFSLMFRGAIFNRYGKAKAERAFAEACPGWALRIGDSDYEARGNRLVAQSITLSGPNVTVKTGLVSLTGVHWTRLLVGPRLPADILATASLEAAHIVVEFPQARYGIHCARLRASVPDSEVIIEGTELAPLVGDDAFFAEHAFRTTRFHLDVPECRVLGLAFGELLQGKSYHARSVDFSRPSFEALVDCDKPVGPSTHSPLMVHEALAAIPLPLRLDSLNLTKGHLAYRERWAVGGVPAVLTFGAVNLTVEGTANRGEGTAAILLHGQANLMDAGMMSVNMSIPVASPDLTFHYSGSLTAMDVTRLDAFLDVSEHTRIKAGSVKEAAFEIKVSAGHAQGYVHATYSDLGIAFLDKQTGSEKGLSNRFASLLANLLKIRKSNAPSPSGSMKEGTVDYTRGPDDTFLQFVWFALRSGVLDVITH